MRMILIASVAVCTFAAAPASAQTTQTETVIREQTDPSLSPDARSVSKSVKSETFNSDGSATTREEEINRSAGGVSAKSRSATVSPDGSEMTKESERVENSDGSSSSTEKTTEIE